MYVGRIVTPRSLRASTREGMFVLGSYTISQVWHTVVALSLARPWPDRPLISSFAYYLDTDRSHLRSRSFSSPSSLIRPCANNLAVLRKSRGEKGIKRLRLPHLS